MILAPGFVNGGRRNTETINTGCDLDGEERWIKDVIQAADTRVSFYSRLTLVLSWNPAVLARGMDDEDQVSWISDDPDDARFATRHRILVEGSDDYDENEHVVEAAEEDL
ncbi:hypothetical protein J3459_014217 [Metarhizium acridum]|uniref:uncharacterized protein n=1 Tax=Metarhizium acridum TaxID=92637 RepID=UPI001C6BCBDA|nr:hypothetical protein J3459_014217 [Metarhizium acridum]KAG8416242.1 hypothetical protein J3458_006838 [Metarhizium acridum]